LLKKLFLGAGCGVWGVGCGVLPIFPRSPQWLALFEGKKVQKSYPTRFLDLFSKPYLGFKNPTKEDSYLKSATPIFPPNL
jgi:hypothetical protein